MWLLALWLSAGVVEEHAHLVEVARFRGRGVDGLLLARDPGLRARFPEAAQALAGARAEAAVLRDFVMASSPELRSYEAEHALRDESTSRTLTVRVSFDANWSLVNVTVRLREPPPPSPWRDEPPLVLRFPIDDRPLLVSAAGDTPMENQHIGNPDQRWAMDLLGYRDGGSHGDKPGSKNSDYAIWGAAVKAPIDGVVVVAETSVADHARPNVDWSDPPHPFGNHVVLEVGPEEFVVIGHLQKGSVQVKAGDKVKAGHLLGRVGNSGNTTEPHLHLHLQDGPIPKQGNGKPFVFAALRREGVLVHNQAPLRGDLVQAPR